MLGAAHVRRTRRGKAPSGLQVQGGALVAPAGAKHPKTSLTKKAAQKTEKLRKGAKSSFLSFFFLEVASAAGTDLAQDGLLYSIDKIRRILRAFLQNRPPEKHTLSP